MSTGETARAAVEVARRLRGAWNADAVAALADLLDPHLAAPLTRKGGQGVLVLGGLPAGVGRDRLARLAAPAVEGALLPALHDAILDRLYSTGVGAAPDATGAAAPDAMECAGAFVALRAWIGGARPGPAIQALGQAISKAVLLRARASTKSLAALIERGDVPDLQALSMDLLRLEGLGWLVEVLGDARAQKAIAELSRKLARVSLTRAAATMEDFAKARDLMALYDNAMVMAQVDNLIVLAQRVLDAHAAGEEERTSFVPTGDEQALAGFILALSRLTDALFALARAAAARPGKADGFFHGLVRQIECLFRLTAQLHHAARPTALDDLEARVRTHLRALATQLAGALADAGDRLATDRPAVEAAVAQAALLGAMLEGHGLYAESGLLATRLNAARALLA